MRWLIPVWVAAVSGSSQMFACELLAATWMSLLTSHVVPHRLQVLYAPKSSPVTRMAAPHSEARLWEVWLLLPVWCLKSDSMGMSVGQVTFHDWRGCWLAACCACWRSCRSSCAKSAMAGCVSAAVGSHVVRNWITPWMCCDCGVPWLRAADAGPYGVRL